MVPGKILLTGGTGMVGRNLLERAAARGVEIAAPGRDELDLLNADATAMFLRDHKPDCVIHAAGLVGGIQANIANPVSFLEKNLAIGRNIVMGALGAGIGSFLNLASTCIYPVKAPSPLKEEMVLTGALEPTNEGYAIAKIAALRLCEFIRRENSDLQYKSLIPCNLYGRFDSFHPEKSHLVPAIIRKVHEAKLSGAETVEIWGDGTARREFMYAGDLADLILDAITKMKTLPDVMNAGLGHDHSINEYYEIAAKILGWDGNFTHDLSRPVGMKQKLCSTERLGAWGWTAPTSLEEGLQQTYTYFTDEVMT